MPINPASSWHLLALPIGRNEGGYPEIKCPATQPARTPPSCRKVPTCYSLLAKFQSTANENYRNTQLAAGSSIRRQTGCYRHRYQ